MADTKISGLSAVAAFATTQEFAVNDSGTSRKISGAQLQAAFPLGTLAGGFAQVTANQGSITNVETDLTTLTVTVTVGTGRRIRVSFAGVGVISSVGTDTAVVKIYQDGVQVGQQNINPTPTTVGPIENGSSVLTPSAGSHTYKLTLIRNSGTGTLTMSASVTAPAYILVEDIGV